MRRNAVVLCPANAAGARGSITVCGIARLWTFVPATGIALCYARCMVNLCWRLTLMSAADGIAGDLAAALLAAELKLGGPVCLELRDRCLQATRTPRSDIASKFQSR